jgi:inhibitor of KinA sporulation pathway (predicted exonuclease)
MQIDNKYYLIVDLEATCSDEGAVPREEMEIIEIGAVLQSSRTYEIESEFQSFIQPVRHPELTEFCTSLTGIRQSDVASAPLFLDAVAKLGEWMYEFDDALFCSWGDYDRKQFEQDCRFHGVGYPFRSSHCNLKAQFSDSIGLRKKMGVVEALRYLGLEFVGSHHRGLDDARNMARIVRRVCTDV